jgi:hypothetical protein
MPKNSVKAKPDVLTGSCFGHYVKGLKACEICQIAKACGETSDGSVRTKDEKLEKEG